MLFVYLRTKLVSIKIKAMLVISTREFRESQGKYLEKAKRGESVVIKSRGNGSFKLVPITEDDTLMSKEDFFRKLDKSLQQAKDGKTTRVSSKEELKALLDSL